MVEERTRSREDKQKRLQFVMTFHTLKAHKEQNRKGFIPQATES